MHKFPRQAVEGRKERHADDHAHKTEQVAADHDGKQDPQGRDADGRAQDLRADEVAVHLLDDQDQHAEDDRLDRVNQQQNEDAGDRADEGAKYRDNIRDADKHTDEQCKIEPQDRHCHKRDNADDGRVNDLAHKEAREIHVGVMADAQRVFRSLFRQEGMRQRAQLMEQMLLVRQHIDAGRNRGENRHKVRCHAADAGHDLRHGGAGHVVDFLDHRLGIVQHFCGRRQVNAEALLNHAQHILYTLYVAWEVRKQHGDAVHDLRDDQPCQQHKQQNCHQIRQKDRESARLFLLFKQLRVEELDHRVKHIGNDYAARKRRHDADKHTDFPQKVPQIVQSQIQRNTGPDHAEPVQHRFRLFGPDMFLFQMLRSFYIILQEYCTLCTPVLQGITC